VQLIVTTSDGCKDTTLGFPEIYAKPVANFALTPTISCSPLNTSMTNTSLFANTDLWQFGDGKNDDLFNTKYDRNGPSLMFVYLVGLLTITKRV
jgi:PKD repeat protein